MVKFALFGLLIYVSDHNRRKILKSRYFLLVNPHIA